MPQLAPSIHYPDNFSVAQAQAAYSTLCQTDYRITKEAEATTMQRANPRTLTVMKPVQPADPPRHHRRHGHHGHHHRHHR
jgi:hypothetical protein